MLAPVAGVVVVSAGRPGAGDLLLGLWIHMSYQSRDASRRLRDHNKFMWGKPGIVGISSIIPGPASLRATFFYCPPKWRRPVHANFPIVYR